MSNATIELPATLLENAERIAHKSGMSVSDWISATLERQVRIEYITDKYFKRVGTEADGKALLAMLDAIPNHDRQPDPGDEL